MADNFGSGVSITAFCKKIINQAMKGYGLLNYRDLKSPAQIWFTR